MIRGLTDGANEISCTAGKSFKQTEPAPAAPVEINVVQITNFAAFTPQEIEIKIYATNPATAGVTSHF